MYSIKKGNAEFELTVNENVLEQTRFKLGENVELAEKWCISVDGAEQKNVTVTDVKKTDDNKMSITVQVQAGTFIIYELELCGDGFAERITCKYEKRPGRLEFSKIQRIEKLNFMPIPFGKHDEKPDVMTEKNIADAAEYEGCSILLNGNAFVIAKKPSDQYPSRVRMQAKDGVIYYGGFALDENTDCGLMKKSGSETEISFNESRYIFHDGGITDGFYTYRKYMSDCGVKAPANYNPPTNYCIYYECKPLKPELPECHGMDKEFVRKMTATAKELKCDMLYLDQGWDTSFGSLVWDEERLGDMKETVSELKKENMSLGLLIGMHTSELSFDEDAYRRDKNGDYIPGDNWHKYGICPCSRKYSDERLKRLKKLADDGAGFFSYDFHNYEKPCYCKTHNHSVPSTAYEQAKALADNQRAVKEYCTDVLIESHDWLDAGIYHYPIYMFGEGHHERWGFEYMWKPLEDYKSGRLFNLYYYNLAYEKPLYLHMNLLGMGENAEVFWYFASTIRHLGIGNYSALEDSDKKVIKEAMAVYDKLKKYYTNGVFYGKNPSLHIHCAERKGAVINIFSGFGNEDAVLSAKELHLDKISDAKVLWGNAEITAQEDSVRISGIDGAAVIEVL